MGGFVRDVTGAKDQKAAARSAAKTQSEATDAAIAYQEEATAPFRALGEEAIAGFQPFLDDPSGYSFLQSNPMFQAAVDNANSAISNASAAGGKFNSGGTVDQLFQNYLAMGDQFTNSAFNRAFAPVQFGGNVATGNATSVGNLITNNANAQAAAQIQAGNAQANMFGNLLQGATTGLAAYAAFSDVRLKTDIKHIGKDADGNNRYQFSYIGSPDRYEGYLAQEIERVDPGSVTTHESGYKMVGEKYRPVKVN